ARDERLSRPHAAASTGRRAKDLPIADVCSGTAVSWLLVRAWGGLSAVLLPHATPSLCHQRHIGRVLRSSCHGGGQRLASSRGRKPGPGRCPPLWPRDLRNDGGRVATADGSEA